MGGEQNPAQNAMNFLVRMLIDACGFSRKTIFVIAARVEKFGPCPYRTADITRGVFHNRIAVDTLGM